MVADGSSRPLLARRIEFGVAGFGDGRRSVGAAIPDYAQGRWRLRRASVQRR